MFEEFDADPEDAPDADDEDESSSGGAPLLPPPRENPECFGHEGIEETLARLAAQDRLPHALIFGGPEGIGKMTMAFRLARHMLKGPAEPEPMGLFGPAPAAAPEGRGLFVPPDDPVFRRIASGGHPDLMVVERTYDERQGKRKDSVDIDGVRKINPFMRMTASRDGGWRVAIVDDADTMTRQAQNGILKILEEPPERAVLILVAHRPGALIPTIRSRCRVLPFQPPPREIFDTLAPRLGIQGDSAMLSTLYGMTGGSAGRAAAIAGQKGLETLSRLTSLLGDGPDWNWPDIHALAENMGRKGQESAYAVAESLLAWIVSAMLKARGGVSPLPDSLKNLAGLCERGSRNDWIEVYDAVTGHLDRTRFANLDKRQGIIGTFAILSKIS